MRAKIVLISLLFFVRDANFNAQNTAVSQKLDFEELAAEQFYRSAVQLYDKNERKAAYDLFIQASNLGHVQAKSKVAWAYLLGGDLNQDWFEAERLFQELADKGKADGLMGLGFMAAAGLNVEPHQGRALIFYTFAAAGGNVWAKMALGYRYLKGVSLLPNCEQALLHYRPVADVVASETDATGGVVMQRVRLIEENDNSAWYYKVINRDMLEYFKLMAEKGDVHALTGLGQLYFEGRRDIERDRDKAVIYFHKAAEKGNGLAAAYLGRHYFEMKDYQQALKYYSLAANKGISEGKSGLGRLKMLSQEYEEAVQYLKEAADTGWGDAQLFLGLLYFNGTEVQRNLKAALKYFVLASQSGHALGMYYLGIMHSSGEGTIRSCSTSAELFKNVAERGRWHELMTEAYKFYKSKRFRESFVRYALLSELGYEVAQSNSAYILEQEFKNWVGMHNRALLYWKRAAVQGYSTAMVKLGDYHFYGLGTNVDYEAALGHYRVASEQHYNPMALFNLGYMHERGLGVRQDYNLARRYYDMAIEASAEAKVPVALAIIKLVVLSYFQSFQNAKLKAWYWLINVTPHFQSNWDVYLIWILLWILGIVVVERERLR